MSETTTPTYGFGATPLPTGLTRFRLWAPNVDLIQLEIDGKPTVAMSAVGGGWHEAETACPAGARYRYRLPDGTIVPDPASRAQDGDAHGASVVADPSSYVWKNPNWPGRPWHETVIYELHAGVMGGFAGVTADLPRLARLGVTAVELMPVAEFTGGHNWGYDGVLPYAPDTSYGTPDALKHLIDTAHGLGLMVFLDVVYNHFGPDGNYLHAYAADFFRLDRSTPWGDAIDFRRPEVCRFFIENAIYWVNEFRFDGLRLDAVHAIGDTAFLIDFAEKVRASVAPERHVHLCLENELNDARLLRAVGDEPKYDAQWADDLHHCIHVLLTGEEEAYYSAFAQAPAVLLARCLAEGFAFQGEAASGRAARGTPSAHLPPTAFIICLQNHDQIGNRAFGDRLHTLANPAAMRAATVLLLLTPQIPLLFMGQEWATKAPFLFFTGYNGELADAVREGRRREFAHFASFQDEAMRERIPDPSAVETFNATVPDSSEISHPQHADWFALHRDLLALRAQVITPHIPGARSAGAEALGRTGVFARWIMGNGSTLTIAANFGAEPLPCPPIAGEVIFQTAPFGAQGLAPRSAVATLQVRSS